MKKIRTQLETFFSAMVGGKEQKETKAMMETTGVYEKFSNLDSFIFLWKNCLKKMSVRTNVDISFSRYFTFGSDLSYISKFVGNPVCSFNDSESNISILLYTVKINGHHVNFELHFYDRKLFCINYTYNYLSRQERAEILYSLEQKYHVSSSEFNNHIIVDNSGNGILVEEKDKLTINYLAPNSQVKHLTESYPHHRKHVI